MRSAPQLDTRRSDACHTPGEQHPIRAWRPPFVGLAGAAGLLAFYIGIITWAQGWGHALDQLQEDLWFIAPITAGFGVQVGLFTYLRQLHAVTGAGLAATAGSTGISGSAMLACCAHHLSDVLPIVGAGGAAIFLNEFKTPIAAAGIVTNAAGVMYFLLRARRIRNLGPSAVSTPIRALLDGASR